MSDELLNIGAARGPVPPPRVELYSGQYQFVVSDNEGRVHEKLVAAADVAGAFANVVIDTGWIPPGVRRCGSGRDGEWAVLFVPPGPQAVELLSNEPGAAVAGERVTVPLPGAVVFGSGVKYFVWAVKGSEINPHAEIYRFPAPNVEPDSSICYGGHRPPRCTAASIVKAWEVFVRTPFNNHRCDGKSKRSPEDVRSVWRELAAAREGGVGIDFKEVTYPVEDLVRQVEGTGVTLDAALRGFLEEGEMPW